MSDLSLPFERRAELLLCRVFGGMHHVYALKKFPGKFPYWTCNQSGGLATFDFNELTNLVLGAHEYAIRVEIENGGPYRTKLMLHDRGTREGAMHERHSTIEQAIESWRGR